MSCEDILKQRCADDSHDGIYWITLRRSEKLYNHGKNLLFSPYPTNVFALCGRSQHRLRSLYIRRYYRDRRAIRILLTYKHLQSAWYPSPLTQKLLSPGLGSWVGISGNVWDCNCDKIDIIDRVRAVVIELRMLYVARRYIEDWDQSD
jgi:hypothetical protein